jgi:hypothetical protein
MRRVDVFTNRLLEGAESVRQTLVSPGVPSSVPERGPRTIIRQPTPTKFPTKNGPEIINFRPIL